MEKTWLKLKLQDIFNMKKHILTPFFSFALLTVIIVSCADNHIYKGDRYYESLAYAKAIPHYEKVYFKKPDQQIGARLADSYYRTGQYDAAEAIFERVVSVGNTPDVQYFNYARVLMANGKYERAKQVLQDYLRVNKKDPVASMLLASCNAIDDRYRDTTLYALKEISTPDFANAFSVIEYQEGIVFVADKPVFSGSKQNPWTGNSYLELYQMEKDDEGTWLNPQLLQGDVNGKYHEGPATFSKDGSTVFFTRSNYYKRKMTINDERENNLKIFSATLVNGEWKNLKELPFNSDDYSVGHPTLSPDGSVLYFVSDMPGGNGGTDLYFTRLENGQWSAPVNLGETINTPGNEMFPYMHEDGSLYFSSDAHNSMGGLDVFITYNNGKRWAEPENLNYPINSMKDDFSFVLSPSSETGFVSSSRMQTDKIYEFKKFDPTFNLIGFAHEKGNSTPIEGVTVEITNAETGEVLSVKSDKKGNFKIKLAPEAQYRLLCTKMGCFSRTDEVVTKGLKYSQDFFADFEVEEIVIDKPIVLKNIYYDFDRWEIRPDAAKELDKLVKLLQDNPNIDIEMGSHTDVRGSDQYNEILSERRAYAAVQYLISRGIDSKRLQWKGYGEKVLVNECTNTAHCSEEKHQENRRTEFKVTKIRE